MEFTSQMVSDFQAHTQEHLTRSGFPYKATGSVSEDNSIDITLRDPSVNPSKGVVLRLSEEFLRFSDQHRVYEVLEQQASYFSKQGLKDMEGDGFPVIVIGAT
ncbi:hypothetical protein [Deinococcus cellulosilyticus]|uniref:Uncharacterized protein n=1 Tax=Deinococcus cellulosilyticus (strain DSM 18568 / NBRC 106333 / KACC 11606 / 5516J-15) TaxID=1223518 RepID=A0A511N9T5_DEIC1|nr:hypothetical protein [Deinococcus cellulosilyticus]GEM49599.1 hypothetical protein DC3_52340 [Deinococcus cellulosilyticus NBRC 106333 = KACC 11606]